MENALTTSQPVGTRVSLMTSNQEIIQAEVSASSSGGGQAFAMASNEVFGVDVPADTPTNIDLDLGSFPGVTTAPQIMLDGVLRVNVPPGAELQAFVVGTYELQLSIDGGANYISGFGANPFSCFADAGGVYNADLALPLAVALDVFSEPFSGNLFARVIVTVTGLTAGGACTCAAYVGALVGNEAPA